MVAYVIPVSELGKELNLETKLKIGNNLMDGEEIRRIALHLLGGENRHKVWRRPVDGEKIQWTGELPAHGEWDWRLLYQIFASEEILTYPRLLGGRTVACSWKNFARSGLLLHLLVFPL